jgi:adenylate cyclase
MTDQDALKRLLHDYNEQPNRRERIVAEIEQQFQHRLGILVLDSCGFSRMVRSAGIIHFLALLERLERLTAPIIAAAGGRLLRREADNIFAVFPDAETAVAAAAAIVHDVTVANGPLPAADEMYVSVGVGYGDVLLAGPHDLFGDEMNVACKLGEDLAQQSEILLTATAYTALQDSAWQFEEATFSISGLELTAYRLIQDHGMIDVSRSDADPSALPAQG